MSHDTVVDCFSYDAKKSMIFGDVKECNIPNSKLKYQTVNISSKNPDGTIGGCYLNLPELFSFGVNENRSLENPDKITGHSVALAMFSRDGATNEEKQSVETLKQVINLVSNNVRESARQNKLFVDTDMLELKMKKLETKILYQAVDKMTKKIKEPERGPTFNPKIAESKTRKDPKTGKEIPGKVDTVFYHKNDVDSNGEPKELNPLDYISHAEAKKYFKLKAVIKIDHIYIGSQGVSVAMYVTEAILDPLDTKYNTSLLKRNVARFAPNEQPAIVFENSRSEPSGRLSGVFENSRSENRLTREEPPVVNNVKEQEQSDGESEKEESESEDEPEPEPVKLPTPPPSPKKEKKKKEKKDGEEKKKKKKD